MKLFGVKEDSVKMYLPTEQKHMQKTSFHNVCDAKKMSSREPELKFYSASFFFFFDICSVFAIDDQVIALHHSNQDFHTVTQDIFSTTVTEV